MRQLLFDPMTWVHLVGYTLACLLPAIPLCGLGILWWRLLAHEAGVPEAEIDRHHRRDFPFLIGATERISYVAAWLLDRPEFVGVWLALKVAGGWNGWAKGRTICWPKDHPTSSVTVEGRHEFNTFLLGTAISLLNALAWAKGIQWWVVDKDYARAVVVPIAASVVTWLWWGITAIQWRCAKGRPPTVLRYLREPRSRFVKWGHLRSRPAVEQEPKRD